MKNDETMRSRRPQSRPGRGLQECRNWIFIVTQRFVITIRSAARHRFCVFARARRDRERTRPPKTTSRPDLYGNKFA